MSKATDQAALDAVETTRNGLLRQFEAGLSPLSVEIKRPEEVESYLNKHSDMSEVIEKLCKTARREFDTKARLSLEVYQDPEIHDEHLTLCVRLPSYTSDVLRRIRAVSASHEDELQSLSGSIIVTTDFCPIG